MRLITNTINPPVNRMGVYRIWNIESGKSYVGKANKILNRLYHHNRKSSKAPKLITAFNKHGLNEFTFEPIYLLLENDQQHLSEAETTLILEFDCIENGYNIYSDNNGPMPPDFNARVKKAINRPETKLRHLLAARAAAKRPDVRANLLKAQAEIRSRPGYLEKLTVVLTKQNKDPANRQKNSDGVVASWQDPEIRARHIAARTTPEFRDQARKSLDKTDTIWITDGFVQKRIPFDQSIPDGFEMGRGQSGIDVGKKGGSTRAGKIWITNGLECTVILPTGPIPNGWRRGKLHKHRPRRLTIHD